MQPFKKGPDYIDPNWLSSAAGRNCYNLDFNVQSDTHIRALFDEHTSADEVAVVEANKGLYDGLSLDGGDSNAALACLLKLPVILVLDCEGVTRGVAPLLQGYLGFDLKIRIAGVVLNKVGGNRHESKLRAAIREYVGLPVVGTLMRDARLQIPERHLGLIPGNEMVSESASVIEAIASVVDEQVDCGALLGIARDAGRLSRAALPSSPAPVSAHRFRLGLFRDAAFGFYYPDDLESLERCGAEIVPIDSLHDTSLPPVDALFIGGGFPETQVTALEANRSLRNAVKREIEAGLPVYAECGGLMYLTRSIEWQGRRREMAGVLPADTIVHAKPQGRGYVRMRETEAMPWPRVGDQHGDGVHTAHEFHYSSLTKLPDTVTTAFEILRGEGICGGRDGIVYKNLLATYLHQRGTPDNPWPQRFAEFVVKSRSRKA